MKEFSSSNFAAIEMLLQNNLISAWQKIGAVLPRLEISFDSDLKSFFSHGPKIIF